MFGTYANSVTRDVFKDNLAKDGWKFFEFHNLNELFHIMYEAKVESGEIDRLDEMTSQLLSIPSRASVVVEEPEPGMMGLGTENDDDE